MEGDKWGPGCRLGGASRAPVVPDCLQGTTSPALGLEEEGAGEFYIAIFLGLKPGREDVSGLSSSIHGGFTSAISNARVKS